MGFIYAFLTKEREHSRQQVHGECKRAEQELTTTTATTFHRCCERNNDFREHQGASELEFKNSFSAIKKARPSADNVNYDYGHYDIPRRMPTHRRAHRHSFMPRHHDDDA
jgi:hypothetical protein